MAAPRMQDRLLIKEVLRLHVEDSAHIWMQFVATGEALPEDDPGAVRLKRRLFAHLRGAELGGEVAWQMAVERAALYPEPPEIFTLAWLALADPTAGRLDLLFDAVETTPATLSGLNGAVVLAPREKLALHVKEWLVAGRWAARAAGLAACAQHRQDLGAALAPHLRDERAELRAIAVRALVAVQAGRDGSSLAQLEAALCDPARRVRFEAALALAAFGRRRRAWEAFVELTDGEEDRIAEDALDRAATLGLVEEVRGWVRSMANDETRAGLSVRAVGVLGDSAAWPWLIERMERPGLALSAGLAACDLLGCDLTSGSLFTDERGRLPPAVAAAYDDDFAVLPDPHAFRAALVGARLAPVPAEDRSLRARKLDRQRAEARLWAS